MPRKAWEKDSCCSEHRSERAKDENIKSYPGAERTRGFRGLPHVLRTCDVFLFVSFACAGMWVLFNGLLAFSFLCFMPSLSLTGSYSEDEPVLGFSAHVHSWHDSSGKSIGAGLLGLKPKTNVDDENYSRPQYSHNISQSCWGDLDIHVPVGRITWKEFWT